MCFGSSHKQQVHIFYTYTSAPTLLSFTPEMDAESHKSWKHLLKITLTLVSINRIITNLTLRNFDGRFTFFAIRKWTSNNGCVYLPQSIIFPYQMLTQDRGLISPCMNHAFNVRIELLYPPNYWGDFIGTNGYSTHRFSFCWITKIALNQTMCLTTGLRFHIFTANGNGDTRG